MLKGKRDFQAVVFDMDGVLFLSSDCHEEAFRVTVQEYIPTFNYSDIAGMRTDEAFRFLWSQNGLSVDEELLEKLVQKKRSLAIELLKTHGKIAPGTFELLRELRKCYRLVLATSASLPTIELFFSLSHTRDFFEYVLDGFMVKRAKPEPDIYLLAAEKLHLSPQQCVVVEDAVKGAEAAVQAQSPVIIISSQEGPFVHLKPIMVVSEVQEVAKILLS